MNQSYRVSISGTGSYLPKKILTNADLEKMVETSDEWILARTGIQERRIASDEEFTSHMATNAARKALEKANLKAEELELIITATITPDTPTPATSCYVQKNLKAMKAIAFDISAACSGFIYGLSIANDMIANGTVKNAIVIGAEKLSAYVNWKDRSTCILFGDGAGASVLTRSTSEEKNQIIHNVMATDGSKTHLLYIQGGGSACPLTNENIDESLATLAMLGKEIFKHAVTKMGESISIALQEANLSIEDIKLIIPHQANLRIIKALADKFKLSQEKIFVNVEKYGNTSAASVPISLDEAHTEGKIQKGDYIVLVAFGAGLTWGASVIRW